MLQTVESLIWVFGVIKTRPKTFMLGTPFLGVVLTSHPCYLFYIFRWGSSRWLLVKIGWSGGGGAVTRFQYPLSDDYTRRPTRFPYPLSDDYTRGPTRFPYPLSDDFTRWHTRFPYALSDEFLFCCSIYHHVDSENFLTTICYTI